MSLFQCKNTVPEVLKTWYFLFGWQANRGATPRLRYCCNMYISGNYSMAKTKSKALLNKAY